MKFDEPFVSCQGGHRDVTIKPWQVSTKLLQALVMVMCPHRDAVSGHMLASLSWRCAHPAQPHSFELEEDTSAYGEYQRGGIVTQHKEAKTLAFRGLEEATASPGESCSATSPKLERPALLHAGFRALDAFQLLGVPVPQNLPDPNQT